MSTMEDSNKTDSALVLNYSYSKLFRNRPELLQDVKLESPDAKEVLSTLRRSCLLDENIERLWTPENIQLVQNSELENNYKQRKKEFKENGRKGKEIEDRLVFIAETWAGVQKICKFGMRCLENKPEVLGDARYGVHLCRHFDVLLRYMAFSNLSKFRYVIVFKAMFGRTKAVTARLNEEKETIEPLPNYDSHISTVKPDMQMEIPDAIGHNYVYLYEYDEDTSYPVQFPRHVLPYAVIQLSRTNDSIEVPIKWGGGNKKMVKKNNGSFQTTHRKTWNSRAAAYCAGVSGETLKENVSFVDDTNNSVKIETVGDSNITHDIKPCKIELFRSDMDINKRIKVSPNFEFDTVSGTKLIATKHGFVKDARCSYGESSDVEGDTFEADSDEMSGKNSDFNVTPMLLHIKKEPMDSNTQEGSYSINVNDTNCCSFDIKQEKQDKLDSFSFSFDLGKNSIDQTNETRLDTIASNKEVILKRLQQVEREIHWKKQKIDELQKNSNRNVKKEEDKTSELQPQGNFSPETQNHHTVESDLGSSQICMLQNETNRILALNAHVREQQSDVDTEGDCTPTLDEPREQTFKNTEDIDEVTDVVSGNGQKTKPSKSLSGKRDNLFDAYCSNMLLADNKEHNQQRTSIMTPVTSSHPVNQPKALPSLSQNVLPPLPPLISVTETDALSFPITTNKRTEQICGIIPSVKSAITNSKQSPFDIVKNEKRCSAFLAKYLTKKISKGSVDDVKNEAYISSEYPEIVLNADRQESSTTSDNRKNCEKIDEMPQLSPINNQCNDSSSFDFKSTFANIKTIMETGEIPQSPKIEKTTNLTIANSSKIRDPRLLRVRDNLPSVEKPIVPWSLESCFSDNEMGKDSGQNKSAFSSLAACTSTSKSTLENCNNNCKNSSENVKMNWLPGVLIRDNLEAKQEPQKTNVKYLQGTNKDNSMENLKGSSKESDTENNQKTLKEREMDIEDRKDVQKVKNIQIVANKEKAIEKKRQESNEEMCIEKKQKMNTGKDVEQKQKLHMEIQQSQSNTTLVDSKTDLPQIVRYEMQKTLIQLGDAIKFMQSRCSSDENSPSKTKSTTGDKSVNLSSMKYHDNNVQSACKQTVKETENSIVLSDSERANRVLNDVFRSEAVTSSEHHHISTSTTNVHQIQTISSTNIEIKTTKYAETVTDFRSESVPDGYNAAAYSDAPTTNGETEVGLHIPVKLSGTGSRRPYSKWVENLRHKAMERQKRLYKSKLARRFGFDRLKRTADKGKKIDSKRLLTLKSSKKRLVRSRSRSKERSSSHSRSRSKSDLGHSHDVKRSRFPMLPSSEQKFGKSFRHEKNVIERHSSRRSKREKSPVRDRLFLTFRERGIILRKLQRGMKLTYLEKYKLRVFNYRFVRPRISRYENRDTKTGYKRNSASISPNRSRSVPQKKGRFSTNTQSHNDNDLSVLQSHSHRYNDNNTTYSRHSSDRQSDYVDTRKAINHNHYKRPRRDFIGDNGSFKSSYSEKEVSDLDIREQNYFENVSRSLELRNRSGQKFISDKRLLHNHHDDRNTERTLSKAMTTLLSKIIQGDNDQNVDNTTEGQMANVIYQLMKEKVQNETTKMLPKSNGLPMYDSPTSNVDRYHKTYNIRQGDNEVGSSNNYRPRYFPDDRRKSRSSRYSHPYFKSFSSSESRSSRENDDVTRSQEFKSQYSSNKRSPFNGGRGFPNRHSSRGRSTRYNRDRFQSDDNRKDRRIFRNASASFSSSSTSRHDRTKDFNSRSYSDDYFDNPYLN